MKTHRGCDVGSLKCSFCSKEFRYESDRKRHELSHDPKFECKVCCKSFSFISALRRHEKQHLRSGSVTCDKCSGTFRDENLLKRHMQYAHQGTFICPECLTVFNSEAALKSHSLSHQPVSKRKYHCSFQGCAKSFNFPHHLRNHELTHTNEKKFFCNVCGKGFIQEQNFKNHLNTHKPDALLRCSVDGCNKKFASQYTRSKHIATHGLREDRKISRSIINGVVCPKCGDLIQKRKVGKHRLKCVPKDEDGQQFKKVKVIVKNPINEQNIKIEDTKSLAKDNYCKTALGGCMESGKPDMEDNCLCAHMATDIKVFDRNLDYIISDDVMNTDLSQNEVRMKTDSAVSLIKLVKTDAQCLSCECGKESIKKPKTQMVKQCLGAMPSLEFRSDGVIKLRDTVDFNILEVESVGKDVKINIPNSCKAVLGNCIVSGDDTIGDGCLCARMSAEAQQISQQEIEEITIGNDFN